MTREEFLSQFRRSLGGLPEEEKREILADYEEHFRMGAAEGKGEEDISRALGNPRLLGRSYRIDSMLEEGKGGSNVASVLRAVFASLSLGFFNILIVLGPLAGLAAVVVSLWAVAAALALSGVAVVLAVAAEPFLPEFLSTAGLNPAFLVFSGIGVSALGIVAGIGMWFVTRLLARAVAAYVRLNVRIVTNRR